MRLAQPSNPFFHRVQVVADDSARAHLPLAPFLRYRRDDTVFVDIQSKREFFFHWCVCLFDLLKLQRFETLGSRPLVRLCSTSKRRVAREKI
jgi:hypothetical protein